MARRPNGACGRPLWILVAAAFVFCSLAYFVVYVPFRRPEDRFLASADDGVGLTWRGVHLGEDCCSGQEHLELWGPAVNWGANFKLNSSAECCRACKAMCGSGGSCRCNSWVFCGDRERCGEKFGECWLKKQDDVLFPSVHESGEKAMWTSGLIHGKGEGIVGLTTEYGTIRIKLFPDCAPHSVAFIRELLGLRHCSGCQIYRAESRGQSWDSAGNHISHASFGPPHALIQGTLEAEGFTFSKLPLESSHTIRRGSIAWVDSGPEFFISLANHIEWKRSYTVFGTVFSEDMNIVEAIADLETKSDVWNNITVLVLERPIDLNLKRITK